VVGICFYFSKRSETGVTRTGSIFGVGSVTAGWLEIFVFILVGKFVFALMPVKRLVNNAANLGAFEALVWAITSENFRLEKLIYYKHRQTIL
jgi:hypothetical protein